MFQRREKTPVWKARRNRGWVILHDRVKSAMADWWHIGCHWICERSKVKVTVKMYKNNNDRDQFIQCIFIKLSTCVAHDKRMNSCQGQRSKFKIIMGKYGNNLASILKIILKVRGQGHWEMEGGVHEDSRLSTHGNLILQKQFLHFRARLNCDVEQNCLCHVVDYT